MAPDPDRYACDARFPGLQVVRLIRHEIERSRLDLKGLRVLTEASVGYRRAAPVVAALAGADEVYAVGRDSVAASRKEAGEQTAYLAELAHVGSRVKLLPTRLQAPLDTVDVVADLPGVRPVDESIIRNVADTAAVTLLRGAAHWRPADVDAATCRRHGIAVAGLDEEAVGLWRYPPLAVLSSLLDLGVEVAGSTVVVAGDDPVAAYVAQALSRLGARVLAATPDNAGRAGLHGAEKAADALTDGAVAGRLLEADALVLCPADPAARTVGPGAPVDAARLAAAAPHLAVVGLDAEADLRALDAAGLRCRPAGGPDGVFDLLPQAVVARHAAGLKVAEVMTRARRRGSSPLAAEQLAAAEAHAELLPKDLSSVRR
ncbi:MAG TPA: hypothetical protein VMH50_16910 [Thermoleophilia bacterium]|nr:hypothetical protein [Thermoleophilia bacterium]